MASSAPERQAFVWRSFVLVALFTCLPAAAADKPCDQLFWPRKPHELSDGDTARISERWLVQWYPTRAQFEKARARMIDEKTACIARARAEVAALEQHYREFESGLDSYRGRSVPGSARAYLADVAARVAAAKEHERQQEWDLVRIGEVYDAQLHQLRSRPGWN